MDIEILKNQTGHWQDMVRLSPIKKAWREDVHTRRYFFIDESGTCLESDMPNHLEKTRPEKWKGYLDWHPVVTDTFGRNI